MWAATLGQPYCQPTNSIFKVNLKASENSDAFFIFTQNLIIMKTILNIIITTILVMVISYYLPGVTVTGFKAALIVALVLGLLNIFVKPVLVFLTLPATIFTLGLFLLVINAIIILICDALVDGFEIRSFISALLFSLILSVCQAVLSAVLGK